MNNLNLEKVDDAAYMFYNMKEINYLEIKGLKFSDKVNDELNGDYGLNYRDNLLVCKNNESLSIIYEPLCCQYDIELKKCVNYIICKYNTRTEYKDGFQNEYRKNIAFIKNGDSKVGPNDNLIIEANTNIEIYFSESIDTLANFFSSFKEPNAQNIISVDLSNFDSSKVKSTDFMFCRCY